MSKKWYNFFISVEPSRGEAPASGAAPAALQDIARTVADVAALVEPNPDPAGMPAFDAAGSFAGVYEAAGIRPPDHSYSILKVAGMLESEPELPRDARRTSVLLALEAAGASLQEVIQDAVRRDRALDECERVSREVLASLESARAQANRELQARLDRLCAEYRARMQANLDEAARARERFTAWLLKKREEEQKIADAVSYFVTENPITTCPVTPAGNSARSAAPSPSPAGMAGD